MNTPINSQAHASLWITANAGSGKTTFLTRRVVAHLLAGVAPEKICCITYTKAAASEMRSRVLALLRGLLLAEEEACRAQVTELLGRAATAADITRARELFGLVLDSPTGGLQLTTIHGFCQNILRRFPLEAGIAPHFTVLDDSAAELLLRQSKHRLLRHYRAGDPWLDAAFSIIGNRSSEARFDGYIGQIISKRGTWETLWRAHTPETLRVRLFLAHGLEEDAEQDALDAAFCDCIGEAEAAIIRAHLPQLSAHRNKAEQKLAQVLTAWLEVDAPFRVALIPEFCSLFLTNEGTPRKRLLNAKEFPEGAPLPHLFEMLTALALAHTERASALACAQESFAVAILARALLELYAQAKITAPALDYDDLIGKTRELFANPSMLGWVMSKLDHRIDHLLIDEAQDTSGEQWSIAQLLVEELIAANDGVGSGNVPRSLLVVGDEKQSIYSFQGAAPELFAAKYVAFSEMLIGSNAPLGTRALTTSYRSAASVLRLVDHVAAHPDIAPALGAGASAPHRLHRAQATGAVTLYPPILAPEHETAPALTMPLDYRLLQNAAQLVADSVADTVVGWFAQSRMLVSEQRLLAPGDILILVHRRKPLVLPLIRALQRRGVPVAGLDRLTLAEHLAVRDLLALMRWVMNPADDLSLAHVLRSPIIGLSDDALRALCVGRQGTLWERVKNSLPPCGGGLGRGVGEGESVPVPISPSPHLTSPARGEEFLERALNNRDLSPYEFLTDILETGDARRRFAARFGEEVHEVFDELKAQAAAMPVGTPPTLAYFYEWIAGSDRQIKREQESGAAGMVRIMTVHGAKGLEAPVVLLVDTVNPPTTQHEMVYFARDGEGQTLPILAISEEAKQAAALANAKETKSTALMAEYYRLLYVALTRARDELHVWGTANKKGEVKPRSWYALVAESMRGLGAAEEAGALVLRDPQSGAGQPRAVAPLPLIPSLPTWATTLPPELQTAVATLSPSQLAPAAVVSPYAQSGGKAMQARGVRIHRVLELLTAECHAATVAQLVALISPDWSASEQASATREITALLNAERWIWQSPAHAEVNLCGTITVEGVAIPVNGQIDRLIETTAEITILDYKTGRHIPAAAAEIPLNYRLQLKTYQTLIAALYPHKPVRCAILWTATARLMRCDEAVAATPWPNQFVMNQRPLVA